MAHDAHQIFIHELKLEDLEDYSLQGAATISNIAHPGFEFVRDGWVAAAAICKFYGHQDLGHDSPDRRAVSHAVDLLLNKKVHLDDIALEEFAVAERREDMSKREYVPHLVGLTKQFWEEACRRGSDAPNSVEIVRERAARDPYLSHSPHAKLRIHRPIPYLIPKTNEKSLFGFAHLLDDHFVPKSAIFFAVRLRTLSELADGLHHLRPGSGQHGHGMMEIYSELVCMLAYYLGIEGARIAPEDGEFDLGFYHQTWLDTYKELGEMGSRVLGLDGYQHHRDFLVSAQEALLEWCEGAIQWWIPERTREGRTRRNALRDRLMLRDQLMRMMEGLYDIMGIAQNPSYHPIARSRALS